MAKPTNNVAEWAEDKLYTNGPYAGFDTKLAIPAGIAAEGFIPGAADPSAAEHVNDYWNKGSLILRWVFAGTSDADANAHIVETDDDGKTNLQALRLVPTVPTTRALEVYSEAADGAVAGYFESLAPNGAPALTAKGLGGEAILAFGGDGTYAIEAYPELGNEGGGLFVTASGPWAALSALGADGQYAGLFDGVSSGDGLWARAGVTGATAIYADGRTSSNGLYARGGTSDGYGVEAHAQANDRAGVVGYSSAAANAFGAGLLGLGLGGGNGGYFDAEDGWGVAIAAPSGPKAALAIGARSGLPSDTTDGQVSVKNDDGGSGDHILVRSGEWRGLWTTRHGYCGLQADGPNVESQLPIVSVPASSFGQYNAPKQVGEVLIEYVAEIGRTGTCKLEVDVWDDTAGFAIESREYDLFESGAGVYERQICLRFKYTLPATGDRTFHVEISRSGGGGTDVVRARDNTLTVTGVFD